MTLLELKGFGLSRSRVAAMVSLSLLAAGFEGFGMAMFLPVLSYIEKGREAFLLQSSQGWRFLFSVFAAFGLPVNLVTLLLAVLLLLLIRVGLVYTRQVYTARVTQDVLHTTRNLLFGTCLRADYSLFDTVATGHVVNAVTTETVRMASYFSALFQLFSNSVVVLGFLGVLLWISWPMTLFAVALLCCGGMVVTWCVRRTRELSLTTTTSNKDFAFLLVERLMAVRLVKLSAAEERESRRVEDASARVRDNLYQIARLNARIDLVLEPFVVVAGLVLLFVSVAIYRMDLAQVGLFMVILLRTLPLCKEFLRSRQTVHANSGSLAEVRLALEQAREKAEPSREGACVFAGPAREIRFDRVTFRYPDQEKAALSEINLTIPAHRVTALVGPSGAGKSTLVDLLPRMRRPVAGAIFIDDTPLDGFTLSSLRRGMAFVSQDAVILNDTVRANIAFARPDAGEEDIWHALEKARAREFVESLPQGIDTILGERGMRLSGGQKQRISLARAFVQNAPVLILDEPTSALDSETEKDIQEAIDSIRREGRMTIIVIAHRLSTIRAADKIVVVDQGRVVEQGTHRELMISEEWYARVSGMQSANSQGRGA